MREHTHWPTMVGFVRKHVAQHFQANRPRLSPPVSAKHLDTVPSRHTFAPPPFRFSPTLFRVRLSHPFDCAQGRLLGVARVRVDEA